MKLTYQVFYILIFFILSSSIKAQVGYGTNTPEPSSVIDMTSANKGFLPSRVKLISTNVALPIASPANYLLVYNTETSGTPPNNVKPGYYYYLTNKWIRLSDEAYWDLAGISGFFTGAYLGTTDDQDLIFKVANTRVALLNNSLKNTSFGRAALRPTTTGTNNVAAGYFALLSNNLGSNNIATGYETMMWNTNGSDNIASGYQSFHENNTGNGNVAFGIQTLYSNNGSGNIAMLQNVLFLNSTGNYNIGTGLLALFSNTTGSNNIGIGYTALQNNSTGNNNIALGLQALVNTTSSNNIGVGSFALFANGSGANNIGIGASSLSSLNNNTSNNNTSNGYQSLQNFQNGSNNTALGYNSLNSLINGSNANAMGSAADFANTAINNQLNISNAIFGVGFSGSNVTTPVGKVGINVTNPNSTLQVSGSVSGSINALSIGTLTAQHFTILVGGDIILPSATTCKGRIYNLINDTPAVPVTNNNITIQSAGSFVSAGVVYSSLTISNSGLKKVTVQSDGTNWQLISKFQ